MNFTWPEFLDVQTITRPSAGFGGKVFSFRPVAGRALLLAVVDDIAQAGGLLHRGQFYRGLVSVVDGACVSIALDAGGSLRLPRSEVQLVTVQPMPANI